MDYDLITKSRKNYYLTKIPFILFWKGKTSGVFYLAINSNTFGTQNLIRQRFPVHVYVKQFYSVFVINGCFIKKNS